MSRSSASAGRSPTSRPDKTLISEFGLSLHVESQRGDEIRHLLVDYGFTPEALLNNAGLLGHRPGRGSTRWC